MKRTSAKNNPLFNGYETLDFDSMGDEMTELTQKQKVEEFTSRYMRTARPFSRYKRHFDMTPKEINETFGWVKTCYINKVINGDWTEHKYVSVLDEVFTNRSALNSIVLDTIGMKYDRQHSQQRRRRRR